MNANLFRLIRWPIVLACLLTACAPAARAQPVPEEATATVTPTATQTEAPTATAAPTDTALPPTGTATASPTPVPPTKTPIPTATRTPTPGPGDIVYSPSRTSDWDYWRTFYFGGERFTLSPKDGNLTMKIDGADTWVYEVYGRELPYPDVQIDVDVEIVKGPNRNNLSVVCRESNDGWYEFNILSGGLWSINKYVEGEDYKELRSGGSTAIRMNQDVNHLTAVCAGDTLTFYVNDVKLASVRDRQFKTGRVGLSGSTFDIGHLELYFQNFVVRVADPEAPLGAGVAPTVQSNANAGGGSGLAGLLRLPVPGSTLTGPALQADTLRSLAVLVVASAPAGCADMHITSSEVLQVTKPFVFDEQGLLIEGEWVERWGATACEAQTSFRITYQADGSGGVSFNIAKLP